MGLHLWFLCMHFAVLPLSPTIGYVHDLRFKEQRFLHEAGFAQFCL